MRDKTWTRATALGLLLTAAACGSSSPTAQEPVDGVQGEAALEDYPEQDARRSDQYDPGTETDAYMHRDSNDDKMLEHQCMKGDCPEGP